MWALYCRSMLLWNCCVRFQDDTLTGDQKTQIAIAVFVEIRAVERALDAHICNIDTALMYMCREFISKWVSSVPATQSFCFCLLTSIVNAMQHETVCDISDETVGFSNWCVFQDLTVPNCRLLLDLDVTARPVWNRRLAEEWRASSSCATTPLRMLTCCHSLLPGTGRQKGQVLHPSTFRAQRASFPQATVPDQLVHGSGGDVRRVSAHCLRA